MSRKDNGGAVAVLHATKNDLSADVRATVVDALKVLLADALDLQSQCKQAHWNVKGKNFIALHELFDKVYEAVTEYVDLIAERAVQLGATVEGTARATAAHSRLGEYPLDITAGSEHVEALSSALAAFGASARAGIQQASDAGDQDSADVLTEISRGTDKWLWFVESHAG
jgi:starvation-inducible DNA-binding protein